MIQSVAAAKPAISIVLDGETAGELRAHNDLSALLEGKSFHDQRDMRHPLGTYNASISRISDKLLKAAKSFEEYSTKLRALDDEPSAEDFRTRSQDYLELLIYATAEHVDDVENILKCFFEEDRQFSKSSNVRAFKKGMSPIRSRISSFANVIKHAQSRIRYYAMDFAHNGNRNVFIGFFFEGYKDRTICPSPVIHDDDRRIFSVNFLFWEVILFIHLTSDMIHQFLIDIGAVDLNAPSLGIGSISASTISVARLPIYSFDDVHPFERVTVNLISLDKQKAGIISGIYGSLSNPWRKEASGQFLASQNIYEGDGVTRSFKIVDPKALRLQHWT